jgi:8-amino-7-oxononanoate synthase
MKSNPSLLTKLEARKELNEFRQLNSITAPIDFLSNDYLGLARSQEVQKRIEAGPLTTSIGSTGSRLLSGNSSEAEKLEDQLSVFFESKALLFNSGYAANQGVLSSVPQRGDVIIYDELSHACIKDGARLSMASKYSFKHNDVRDLERQLEKIEAKNVYVVVESIYSMDGDQAPLKAIAELCEKHEAYLMVDEAHSVGVCGEKGKGLIHELGIQSLVWCAVYTFGKAFGAHGACVVGSPELFDYLVNFSRPFIYTTALPSHSLITISTCMKSIESASGASARRSLLDNITYFKANCLSQTNSESAIQPIIVGDSTKAKMIAEKLRTDGLEVRAVLSPTVPKGSERLRICIHAYNTKEELDSLIEKLNANVSE